MIKMKGGFTLIEVSLFLAITGLLFLGVTIGVQNSVFQQRYNDSVQNFVEFLRSAYAKTENVQNYAEGGNTDKAIYGKLITFGEKCNLSSSNGNCAPNTDGEIFMYSVIGNASCGSGFNGTLEALGACEVSVLDENGEPYLAESYKPKWSAAIQSIEGGLFNGAVLITRHPQSGTIFTFVKNGAVEVNEGKGLIKDGKIEGFDARKVDFCVNPNGDTNDGGARADVRIKDGARNTSGIEVMPDDQNDCNKKAQ